jgi:ABC-type transport system involved in multi-copper enzyme maturation permease subunit
MNLFPLVSRELRVALRRRSTFRFRSLAGGGAMAVAIWSMLVLSDLSGLGKDGRWLFQMLAAAGFFVALLAGVFLAADTISQELREGTLGLCFLTDLKPRDIIFGKMAAKALLPLYGFVSILPTLAICLLLGGITHGEVFRVFLAILNALFFSLAISIFASTRTAHQHRAHGLAAILVLIQAMLFPLLARQMPAAFESVQTALLLFTPTSVYEAAFDSTSIRASETFMKSLVVTQLESWLLLILACRALPRLISVEVSNSNRATKSRLPAQGRAIFQISKDDALLANPVEWLGRRGSVSWPARCIIPGLALLIYFAAPSDPWTNTFGILCLLLLGGMHLLVKLRMVSTAVHASANDRRDGNLESLLGTRLSTEEIASGMAAGCQSRFKGVVAALVIVDLFLAAKWLGGQSLAGWLALGAGGLLVFDWWALCWVGLWRGLELSNASLAFVSAVWRSMILRWLLVGFVAGVFYATPKEHLIFLGMLLLAASNAFVFWQARRNLLEHFRIFALRPFGEKPPSLESRWSPIMWEEEAPSNAQPRLA